MRSASREDLYPVLGVGVEISSALRTALIPDVAILNARPIGVSFPAQALELAVEVWSPGNTRSERETKVAAYAAAQVPYLWIVDHPDGPDGPLQFRAHQLAGGVYKEVAYGCAGAVVTAAASPIPVTLDLAELQP